MEKMPDDVKVKSLYKAIKLLDYFNSQNPERGISELSELSGMLKSSVHNIMSTFEKCGIIEKNVKTNKYHLGLKLLALSNVLSQSDNLRQTVKPFMDDLANKTGETVFLATPYGTEIIYLESAFPSDSLSRRFVKGVTAPMYCTSIGKAILAFMPEETIEKVIKEGLSSFTPNTITDPGKFREHLREIREKGYSIDNMEHEYGIKCVGVPIRNSEGSIVAAISVTGPSLRFSDEKIVQYAYLLKEVSKEIQKRI